VRVYTRTGDDGSTVLGNGKRVSKAALRVAAYGDVDELNSTLGLLLAEGPPAEAAAELVGVQSRLFEVGAALADPSGRFELSPEIRDTGRLERWIDGMAAELPELRSFILPGGGRAAALAHVARTVCRRAERAVAGLREEGEAVGAVLPFLNRLSDALFVCARWLNHRAGVRETAWSRRAQ